MKKDIITKLTSPMDVYERQGPNRMIFKYMKGEDVINRLNEAFDYEWSSEIVSCERSDDFVVVRLKLTALVLSSVDGSATRISKEAFGGSDIKRGRTDKSIIDLGNAYKSAFTNALKKAAEQFGIGLKEEEEPPDEPLKKATVAVVAPTTERVERETPSAPPVQPAPKAEEKTNDSEEERARKLLQEVITENKKEHPLKNVESTSSVKSNPLVIRTTNPDEKMVDMQREAILKLCSINKIEPDRLLVEAAAAKMVPESIVGLKLEDVPKTIAPSLIRFLTQAKKG